jgi:sn1-specific diacylglycerol lipase
MFHHTELFDERLLCFDISHGNTVGDNFLHLHRNALIAHSGLDETDLIYANFNNSYNQMPYSIVIDHKWRSVVISIRGTLSLEGT